MADNVTDTLAKSTDSRLTTGSVTARFQHSSDCNSNRSNPPVATSTTSIDSSVHDTGEYHWCEENGEERAFKEGSSSTTSLATSAPKAPAAVPNQLDEYVALAKTADANLAYIDMEDFRSEDMHSLLIPALCPSSQVGKDGSYSDPSSQGESSLTDMEMSLCKSGPLFSPVREAQEVVHTRHVTTISTDSLNSENEEDLVLAVTCKANMTNYTLAFEGSALMSSASATDPSLDSDYHEQGSREGSSSSESANWLDGYRPPPIPPMPKHQYGTWPHQRRHLQLAPASVAMRTPWSPTVIQSAQNTPVKRRIRQSNPLVDQHRESDLTNGNDESTKCQSLPNLYKKCLNNALPRERDHTTTTYSNQEAESSSSSSHSSTSSGNKNSHPDYHQHNETLSLLQIYMRQKSGTDLTYGETRHKKPHFVHKDRPHSTMDGLTGQSQTYLEDSLLTPPYYDMIASGGGEAWVEDYPSSADEKVGDESSILSASFNNQRMLNSGSHHCRSLQQTSQQPEAPLEESLDQTEISEEFPLTETSEFNASLNIDVLPFNKDDKLRVLVSDSMSQYSTRSRQSHTFSHTANSIDKVIAKIRPFELGLLPSSFEEKLHAKIQGTQKSTLVTENTPKISKSDEAVQTTSTNTNSEATQTSPKKTVDQQTDSRDLLFHQRASCAEKLEPTVYVVFPSYSLPDLSFLDKAESFQSNVVISPQPPRPVSEAHQRTARSRPLSCTDVEKLRTKNFKHIQDWDSLNFLLPPDMKEILSDIPETEPLNLPTGTTSRRCVEKPTKNFGRTRPKSCDAVTLTRERFKSSSTTSTKSSGYRGSSGMCSNASSPLFSSPSSFFSSPLTQLPPLPQSPNGSPCSPPPPYELRSEGPPPLPRRSASLQGSPYAPPRPPLPKGILRKTVSEQERHVRNIQRHHRLSLPVAASPLPFDADVLAQTLSATAKDLARLEEQLQLMGLSLYNESQASKEGSLGRISDCQSTQLQTPVHDLSKDSHSASHVMRKLDRSSSPQERMHPLRKTVSFGDKLSIHLNNRWACVPDSCNNKSLDMEQKQELVQCVSVAAAQLCRHLHLEQATSQEAKLSPSRLVSIALSPALYTLISDGLKPSVSTLFGQVSNSVWKVIEAATKLGPTLPWLDELVFCLANEDSLPDGPLRFTAFVTELLNMGALNWWLETLTAKEAVLRRHYQGDSFLFNCNTLTRPLTQELLVALTPLAALPYEYQLDIHPSPLQSPIHGPGEICPTVMEAMGLTAERKKANPAYESSNSSTSSSGASTGGRTESKIPCSPCRLTSRKNTRPVSCIELPRPTIKKTNYRRTISQPGFQKDKNARTATVDAEGFSTIRYQWELRCTEQRVKKSPTSGNIASQQPKQKLQPPAAKTSRTPDKSRIPRPVSCTTPIKL